MNRRIPSSLLTLTSLVAGGLMLLACSGGSGDSASAATGTPSSNTDGNGIITGAAPKATVLNSSLSLPWSLAFLPDGRMLVSQKGGTMLILSADGSVKSAPITVPGVWVDSQGGLMDVALDPDFASNATIYWTMSTAGGVAGYSTTVVQKGQLVLSSGTVTEGGSVATLQNIGTIYTQTPAEASSAQYGSRIAFRSDKTLYVTLGDRRMDDPAAPSTAYAQSPTTTLGKVVRLQRDGSAAGAGISGALPEIWSLGHRNPQAAAIHPTTGDLWVTEHGPQGGDELNHVQAGANYGWPLRSYGCPYTVTYSGSTPPESCRVGGGTHTPGYTEPVSYWASKSIAPSGMIFYTGSKFPEWTNNVLMGAMQSYNTQGFPEIRRGLWHLVLNGDTVVSRERLDLVDERVRDVRQGPDGWIYLLTDSGQLIRIER